TRVTLMRARAASFPASHGSLIDPHPASNCNHGECGRHDLRSPHASGSDLRAPGTFHASRVAGRSEYGTTGLTQDQLRGKLLIRVFYIQDNRVISSTGERGDASTVGSHSGHRVTASGSSLAMPPLVWLLSGVTR